MLNPYRDLQQKHGQNVTLLETPTGVTIVGSNGKTHSNGSNDFIRNDEDIPLNEVQRRHSTDDNGDDDSFEYATDRESSVYNPTTVPIRSVMASAGGRNSQKVNNASSEQSDLLKKGNELGIPESRFSRWIPKDQREILEKQAKLLANRIKPKTPEPLRNPTISSAESDQLAAKTTAATSSPSLSASKISLPHETEI